MDPDVLDEVEFRLEVDYSVGEDIKERVRPIDCSSLAFAQVIGRLFHGPSTTSRAKPWNTKRMTTRTKTVMTWMVQMMKM